MLKGTSLNNKSQDKGDIPCKLISQAPKNSYSLESQLKDLIQIS